VAVIAYLGLGANLAVPLQQLKQAIAAIERLQTTRLLAVAPIYQSEPIEVTDEQPVYYNTVLAIETALTAPALLKATQAIEQAQGRDRHHWHAARSLDIDLLLYGSGQIASSTLTVPHARLTERAFVLRPLLDLAPQLEIPGKGPARDYLAAVQSQKLSQI
jgi:2-amino-4-hydroxy-6-hydroxymethyldihydropteridine diphosphokinase